MDVLNLLGLYVLEII